jgi:hypothetical protein
MNIRMPNATEAARILREALAEKGVELKHTQVLELIARLQGYRNAHVMGKDAKFIGPIALKALASADFQLREASPYARIDADRFAVTIRREPQGVRVAVLATSQPSAPLSDTLYRHDGTSEPFAAGLAALAGALGALKAQLSASDADDPWCECADCGTRTRESKLKEIRDFSQRVMPGEECPAGECPECGALAHVSDDQSDEVPAEAGDDATDNADVSAHWDLVPAQPQVVEVSDRDRETALIDRRLIRYVNEAFGNLRDLDTSDDSIADQTAVEYDGLDGETDSASFWDLLVAPLDEKGCFHLQDGRILCFKHLS